jgi:hypothetical protein
MADEHGQHVMALARDLAGTAGLLAGAGPAGDLPATAAAGTGPVERGGPNGLFPEVDPVWHYGYLFSPALTIGGGTFAVQRNIVAEQVLGLPREPDPERGLSWAQSRRSSG